MLIGTDYIASVNQVQLPELNDHAGKAGSVACVGASSSEADFSRLLVELRLLVDAPSEIKGMKLIAFSCAIGIERREDLVLQQLPLR